MMQLYPIAILAGGLATRLRPLTEKIPKAMVEVAGQPFIAHQLRLLKFHGFRKVVMCVWYKGELIRDFVGDGEKFGLQVEYVDDGEKPLGTAGALRNALHLLGESFFVLYGDSYLPCDYARVQVEFELQGKEGLMTLFHNMGKWDSSNVEFDGKQILSYDKRFTNPRMEYIDYGLGVFRSSVFSRLPKNEYFDLSEVYQELIRCNNLAALEIQQRFYEIGSIEGLKELDALLRKDPNFYMEMTK